jgi:ubiquinone/menaquinone biosynthesis C-methylase UbiE
MDAAEAKKQAVLCWTVAPCGPSVPDLPAGSKPYFEELVAGRRDYAPWMSDALHYADSHGLDVLDVGSGQGIDAYEYASRGARVVGIDLTPRHVELASQHLAESGLKAKFVEGDAETMPFADESFDMVSSNGVLHHTPDIDAALAECLRVLRPGGTLTVVLYNRQSFHYWVTQVLEQGLLRGELFRRGSMSRVLSAGVEAGSRLGARPLVRVYSSGEVGRMLRSAGFESIEVFKRHFRPGDVPLVHRLRLPTGFLDALGRVGGWYVIGSGQKPVAQAPAAAKMRARPTA